MRSTGAWLRLDESALASRVDGALRLLGLDEQPERSAGELPYGHQRLLEVAMGLALEPRLLVLDEPTQGSPSTRSTPSANGCATSPRGPR